MGEAAGSGRMVLSHRETVRAVVAATIGNGLEWFDYISFAFFAPQIAATFFPGDDPVMSGIKTWLAFGIGVVVRPFAGALIGVYGDRIGRRRVLAIIIMAMALGSLTIAVTPGYATIGLAAPILIVLARILQGIAATGEYSSGIAYLVEYAPPGRKYLYGSFQFVSQQLATVLSTLAAFAVSHWLKDIGWAWRLSFLAGIIVAPFGLYIRLKLGEAPEFSAIRVKRPAVKNEAFGALLRHNWMGVLSAVGVVVPGTVMIYLWFLYGPAYAIGQLKLGRDDINLITALTAGGAMLLTPVFGLLSDKSGPWRWFLTAMVLFGLGAYPMFKFLNVAPSEWRFFECQAIAMLLYAMLNGPGAQLCASFFPTLARSTGLGLSINLSVALFGGLAPFYVTKLIALTDDKLIPAYYIIGAVVMGLAMLAIGNFGKTAHAAVLKQEQSI